MLNGSDDGGPVVHPYSVGTLADFMVEASARANGDEDNLFVRQKHHLAYLEEYLRTLACATIIVERGYVDRDFLEDFSAYHVRSFHPYGRLCTRLHFLNRPLTQEQLDAAMLRDEGVSLQSLLQTPYLGFIVLRPLPLTVIGRTCLKPYPPKRGVTRVYPTTYRQEVDLYGIQLTIESVAFQEQDRDVAACATSALWSVLQCTGRKFQHSIPSPVAITGTAAATGGYDERMLPAVAGLTIRQIADTLRYVGLEPHLIPLEVHKVDDESYGGQPRTREDGSRRGGEHPAHSATAAGSAADAQSSPPTEPTANDPAAAPHDECAAGNLGPIRSGSALAIDRTRVELKAAIAAYLGAGIPCLLLLRVTEHNGSEPERDVNHAVAVTGYRIGREAATGYGESNVRLEASRIDKIFVHDDQVGPFAKMEISADGSLQVSWPSEGKLCQTVARSHTLVVPLNHKIRVPFATVLRLTLEIAGKLEGSRERFPGYAAMVHDAPFTWNIRLSSLRDLRQEIAASALLREAKSRLLRSRMPKHIWRIVANIDGAAVLEILLDATDLVQGEMLVDVVVHADAAAKLVGTVFSQAGQGFDATPAHRRVRRELAKLRPAT